MLFHSWNFLVFFVVFFIVFHFLKSNHRRWWLLACSIFFYMFWHPYYVGLILVSTFVDYLASRLIDAPQTSQSKKKAYLIISLGFNLLILGYFKYANFFLDSIRPLFSNLPLVEVILPVGISFYTFQSMSYTIDVYRGQIPAESNFLKLLLYVSFFPQLVAGPIERAGHLMSQLENKLRPNWSAWDEALSLFLQGLVKKIIIADSLAVVVDQYYQSLPLADAPLVFFVHLLFGLQIYCDFSAYSEMAKGLGIIMNIDLMENFKRPYLSGSLKEFWWRWHISLSTWFRDYIYIPLGGSHKGLANTIRNFLIVFLLSGLWHGASWCFVLWGLYHGLGMVVNLLCEKINFSFPQAIRKLITFVFVIFGWIFFRAPDVTILTSVLKSISVGVNFQLWPNFFKQLSAHNWPILVGVIVLSFALDFYHENNPHAWKRFKNLSPLWKGAILYSIIIFLFKFPSTQGAPFLYFQF